MIFSLPKYWLVFGIFYSVSSLSIVVNIARVLPELQDCYQNVILGEASNVSNSMVSTYFEMIGCIETCASLLNDHNGQLKGGIGSNSRF